MLYTSFGGFEMKNEEHADLSALREELPPLSHVLSLGSRN